ncbi:MAG: tetratricopeptide repeat protein [Bacteroidales bacterium]
MGIIKKRLKKKNPPKYEFSEGDIFYTSYQNRYLFYKLLKVDIDYGIYHVLCYKPVDKVPRSDETDKLEVFIYHTPIAANGFNEPKLLCNSELTDNDFSGYYEYLRQTQNYDEIVKIATTFYKEAYLLADQKKYEEAILKYSQAIDLIPDYYEAIDNMAFCKMDLGQWKEAIADFKLSLQVNPGTLLAEFSIGECYLKMGKYKKAIHQFKRALEIDPNHQLSKDMLEKASALDKKQ